MNVVKLVTKEGNPSVISLVEELLDKAKKGEIVAIVACHATPSDWEWSVSEGTPMLEAIGQLDVVQSVLRSEYMDEQ